MAESKQHWIDRNRPPRVQITYDVEIGNAIEKTEIPFVVGIMADLSGLGEKKMDNPVPLKDRARSFVEIDRDNFTGVMAKIKPTMSLTLKAFENVPKELSFSSLDDFNPKALVKSIDTLRTISEERSALRDILTKLDSNDKLYKDLQDQVAAGTLDKIGQAVDDRKKLLAPPSSGDTPDPEVPPKPPKPPKPPTNQ